MKHIIYSANADNKYEVAILIKESAFKQKALTEHYFDPLAKLGLQPDSMIGLSLTYNTQNKAPISLVNDSLETILKACEKLGITTLLVADATYFKKLTGERKAEPHHGYIKPCNITRPVDVYDKINENYKTIKQPYQIDIILSVNYQQLFYKPDVQDRLTMSLETLANHNQGTHVDLGQDIIHSSEYPNSVRDIQNTLERLHAYPELTCDIEAFSLIFNQAGIGTISFAWDHHNGVAFPVDYKTLEVPPIVKNDHYGYQVDNKGIKKLLRNFFETYKGKLTYHGGTYDIKVLIYELFMDNLLDNRGLIRGLNVMYRSIDDTKIITYLATNSTAGNVLGLKPNSFEYTGNYAEEDIKDIRLIPLDKLLKYNLIDSLATWYVKNKNLPIMIADQQQDIYDTIMIPSMKLITHMELTGMPMDPEHIEVMHKTLLDVIFKQKHILKMSQLIKDYEWARQREACVIANLLLKRKVRPIADFYEKFNPASTKQVQELLYGDDMFNLKIIDKTDSGAPAVGAKTLKKHLNHLINKHNLTKGELK